MAHLIDGEILEPWQARWWGESIRTTSGRCIFDQAGKPLWPSDFIEYVCTDSRCNCEPLHLGRIIYIGLDFRAKAAQDRTTGKIIIELQQVHLTSSLPSHIADKISQVKFSQSSDAQQELVVVYDVREMIEPSQTRGRLSQVYMDYLYDPTNISSEPLSAPYTVRYSFDNSRKTFRPTRLFPRRERNYGFRPVSFRAPFYEP